MTILKKMLVGALMGASCLASATPVLNISDFISSAEYFNGFEQISHTSAGIYTGGLGPYSEGGVTVSQIDGSVGRGIWVTLGSVYSEYDIEGAYSWYSNGGDDGYTDIRLTSGADFSSFSLLFRPYMGGNLQYSLLNDSKVVLTGSLLQDTATLGQLGFSGGGFDQVLLRSGISGTFGDGRFQGLQIDSIKANAAAEPAKVPEPATGALFALGLAGFAMLRRNAR